ncbi:MAG: DnaD domain protein [Clostridiales bacterium]|nr:DnaD domain protein [Clostridiales bacterium]
MTFCRFSPSYQSKNQTVIDNVFITDFLPKAPDLCVKAYILGLSKCGNADDSENNLKYFAETLKVCEEDVISLFKYWEDEGLVQVLSTDPIEVRYLPISSSGGNIKKFKIDKYRDFNIQAQELLGERMIMPNEFAEFYNLIERYHIAENALLAIIKYCVDCKGFNISPNYILTVAKDWEREGYRTLEQVQEKIEELGVVDDKMSMILSAIGAKRRIQIEDKELLNKWLKVFGFDLNVILYIVKMIKTRGRKIDVNVLDNHLTKYFEMKLMAIPEIENYENEKENLYNVAVAINKELGVYYEDLTKEIDTYVVPWVNMGFDLETLKMVADNCFKSSIRTLEGYHDKVVKLFKLGIVNIHSYMQYLADKLAIDEKIKKVLTTLNFSRNVNNIDRGFYSTWTGDWGFGDDVILYGAELSRDKANAMQYLNKILSNWNSQGVKTMDKAKNTSIDIPHEDSFVKHNYTKEQITSLINNLDEVEV